MRVTVDRGRCVGSGSCALAVPDVFDQSPRDGRVVLVMQTPDPHLHEATEAAADFCPVSAITVGER
ncbi:ferredoxin [Streptomyces sp. NBC_00328]|uniref:ferredoxin n=1 Tax=Streptomyces sp. NBC_00328 TaxID=2903646 RepID=UPI002E2B92E1|nr:ferredoxin [Streptomyces sp. NBC_00328]